MHRNSLVFQPPFDPSFRGAVDVVIPVRNGALTILPTLASVLGQTLKPRRIIVVNDGSTDDTANIVANVGSNLIELVTTPPVGVSHARNTGIEASRAEFIAFLDADDRWHPDKLQLQLRVFARGADVAVVHCGYALRQLSGSVIEVRAPTLRGFIFEQLLAGGFAGNSSTNVVRREALLRIGGYDESLSRAEDVDLQLRLACRHPFDFTGNILADVMENPDSVTRRQIGMDGQREVLLQNISIYEKWCPRHGLPRPMAQNFRKRITYTAVEQKYGWRWMLRLRRDMQGRSPMSARKIWPNHVTFAGWIGLATIAYAIRWLARAAAPALVSMTTRGAMAWGNNRDPAHENAIQPALAPGPGRRVRNESAC